MRNHRTSVTPAQASLRKAAANRANAQHSTGPTSAAGKAVVSQNHITHGLFTRRPIIETVEHVQAWEAYHRAMMSDLVPEGMLEITLAEQLILAAWRLRRVARFELEQIRLAHSAKAEEIQQRLEQQSWIKENSRIMTWICGAAQDTEPVEPQEAEVVFWTVFHAVDQEDQFDGWWDTQPASPRWTVKMVRRRMRELIQSHGKDPARFLDHLRARAQEQQEGWQTVRRDAAAELRRYCLQHLLPEDEALAKIMRVEAHLSRMLHRGLHELERLQARRLGQPVAPPVAIDVDLTNHSSAAPADR